MYILATSDCMLNENFWRWNYRIKDLSLSDFEYMLQDGFPERLYPSHMSLSSIRGCPFAGSCHSVILGGKNSGVVAVLAPSLHLLWFFSLLLLEPSLIYVGKLSRTWKWAKRSLGVLSAGYAGLVQWTPPVTIWGVTVFTLFWLSCLAT